MARKQYSGVFSGTGFRPVQLSQAELSRMAEESDRVIRNMEKRRQADFQQGMDTLRTMKENAAFEQNERARNQKIEQQNLAVKALEFQFERERNLKEKSYLAEVLGGLATLSKTAGKIKERSDVEREKDQLFRETLEFMGLST
jgi:hypothetical protein